jgi:hypothetical protein
MDYDYSDPTIIFNPEMRVIYVCRFYESKRHSVSHTNMYFLKAEHTAWALMDPLAKVEIIFEAMSSNIYKMAQGNSDKNDMCPERTAEHAQFKHLFIKECACLTHGYDKCQKDVLCKECHSCMAWGGYSEDQIICATCNF